LIFFGLEIVSGAFKPLRGDKGFLRRPARPDLQRHGRGHAPDQESLGQRA